MCYNPKRQRIDNNQISTRTDRTNSFNTIISDLPYELALDIWKTALISSFYTTTEFVSFTDSTFLGDSSITFKGIVKSIISESKISIERDVTFEHIKSGKALVPMPLQFLRSNEFARFSKLLLFTLKAKLSKITLNWGIVLASLYSCIDALSRLMRSCSNLDIHCYLDRLFFNSELFGEIVSYPSAKISMPCPTDVAQISQLDKAISTSQLYHLRIPISDQDDTEFELFERKIIDWVYSPSEYTGKKKITLEVFSIMASSDFAKSLIVSLNGALDLVDVRVTCNAPLDTLQRSPHLLPFITSFTSEDELSHELVDFVNEKLPSLKNLVIDAPVDSNKLYTITNTSIKTISLRGDDGLTVFQFPGSTNIRSFNYLTPAASSGTFANLPNCLERLRIGLQYDPDCIVTLPTNLIDLDLSFMPDNYGRFTEIANLERLSFLKKVVLRIFIFRSFESYGPLQNLINSLPVGVTELKLHLDPFERITDASFPIHQLSFHKFNQLQTLSITSSLVSEYDDGEAGFGTSTIICPILDLNQFPPTLGTLKVYVGIEWISGSISPSLKQLALDLQHVRTSFVGDIFANRIFTSNLVAFRACLSPHEQLCLLEINKMNSLRLLNLEFTSKGYFINKFTDITADPVVILPKDWPENLQVFNIHNNIARHVVQRHIAENTIDSPTSSHFSSMYIQNGSLRIPAVKSNGADEVDRNPELQLEDFSDSNDDDDDDDDDDDETNNNSELELEDIDDTEYNEANETGEYEEDEDEDHAENTTSDEDDDDYKIPVTLMVPHDFGDKDGFKRLNIDLMLASEEDGFKVTTVTSNGE